MNIFHTTIVVSKLQGGGGEYFQIKNLFRDLPEWAKSVYSLIFYGEKKISFFNLAY